MRTLILLFSFALAASGAFAECCGAKGTFVQKKFLHDVEVTLVSTGTWSFEKDKAFIWNTLKPAPSECFNNVAFLNVVVVVDAQTTFKAFGHFFHVVFNLTQR